MVLGEPFGVHAFPRNQRGNAYLVGNSFFRELPDRLLVARGVENPGLAARRGE